MKVYRISKCKYINDLSGYGAFMNGGRWNSVNTRMLYSSQSASLALLETLAHLPSYLAPEGFCLLSLEIPSKEIQELKKEYLPANWNQYPNVFATQKIGDDFINKNNKLILKVPSCIINSEYNYLINPLNEKIKDVKIISIENIEVDKRLKK